MAETLVVVVDRHREHALGVLLADDVVLEDAGDVFRGRNTVAGFDQRALVLLADDIHAQFDAFIADEHGRAGNELAHLMLALAAEGAIEGVLGVARFRHGCATQRGRKGTNPPPESLILAAD